MNKPVVSDDPPFQAGWRDLLSRRYATPLALTCLGVWLHAADSLLVATMLPAMIREIGGTNLIAWTFALYEIGSIVAGAASGLLAVRFGLRRPMAIAAGLFAFGCMVSALAPTMETVLAGRLMQGFGGGGLIAFSFVSIGLLFPRWLMARAMAALSTLWGLSAFMGPLIGGLFVEYGTWRGGFWLFGLKAVLLAIWILWKVEKSKTPAAVTGKRQSFPVIRLCFLAGGIVLVASAGIDIHPLRTPVLALLGLGSIGLFFRLDARHGDNRLMPRNALSLRDPVGAGLIMIFCFTVATIAITLYGPLLMTLLHRTPALVAGYVIACSSIGWSVFAVAVSGMAERHDRKMILAGMLVLVASIVGFLFAVPSGPVWLIALFATLEGAGFGMAWTFVLRRSTYLAAEAEAERVSSAIPTVQRMGYAVGAAFIGIVANAAGIERSGDGEALRFAAMAIFAAGLPVALVGLLAAGRFVLAAPRPDLEQ